MRWPCVLSSVPCALALALRLRADDGEERLGGHVAPAEQRHNLAAGEPGNQPVEQGGDHHGGAALDHKVVLVEAPAHRRRDLRLAHRDQHVGQALHEREGARPRLDPAGEPIGQSRQVGRAHDLARLKRGEHGGRVLGLHANQPDVGVDRFGPEPHAAEQAAAAHTDDQHLGGWQLLHYLHAKRALAGHHVGVIVGRHEAQSLAVGDLERRRLGLVVARAAPQHGGGVAREGGQLCGRGRLGHHQRGLYARQGGGVRDAERMVARRAGHHRAARRVGKDRVCGPAQLEAARHLGALQLQVGLGAGVGRERAAVLQGRAVGDPGDALPGDQDVGGRDHGEKLRFINETCHSERSEESDGDAQKDPSTAPAAPLRVTWVWRSGVA